MIKEFELFDLSQEFTSAKTSINTTKLPAIYKMINWNKYKGLNVFDFGCGKIETVKLIQDYLDKYNINLVPYDPFNLPEEFNNNNLNLAIYCQVFICSNVLNVIREDNNVQDIIDFVYAMGFGRKRSDFYFKIYEGDGSGVGRLTKKDCWQRNMKTKNYLSKFSWKTEVTCRKGVITNLSCIEKLK